MRLARAPSLNGRGHDPSAQVAAPIYHFGLDNHSNDNADSTVWRRGEVWPIGPIAAAFLASVTGRRRIAGTLHPRWPA